VIFRWTKICLWIWLPARTWDCSYDCSVTGSVSVVLQKCFCCVAGTHRKCFHCVAEMFLLCCRYTRVMRSTCMCVCSSRCHAMLEIPSSIHSTPENPRPIVLTTSNQRRSIFSSRLAAYWPASAYSGCGTLLAYTVITWLPAKLAAFTTAALHSQQSRYRTINRNKLKTAILLA